MSQMRAGALLSYLSILISLLVALVYTPIMIRLLGQSEFGLYSLIGSMAAYFSVMDMGLGNAMVRYSARNRTIGDKAKEANLNGLFLSLYLIIGIITTFVGMLIYFKLEEIFGIRLSPDEIDKAKIMVIVLTINFALSFPLSIFTSIIRAYEKFIIDKIVEIYRVIMSPILILPLLFIGFGSVSMVVITTLVNISSLVFVSYYSFTKIKINIKFNNLDFKLAREILGYSFFVFLGVIVDQIYWNTDQFILGIISGTVPVAIYAIGMQFIRMYMKFSTSISGLFLPKVSMMVAKKATKKELTDFMVKYGRLQYIIISYILLGFILFGYPFIIMWAGPTYDEAYYITVIIMVPLCIPLIQNTGISILYAKNLQKFRSVVLIVVAILNVFFSIYLAKHYGGIGVAIATAITLTIGNIIVMNIYYFKKIRIDIPLFWKNIIAMTFPMALSGLTGIIINNLIPVNTIFILALKILIFSIVHITLLNYLVFNSYERKLFYLILDKMRGCFTLWKKESEI